MSEISCQVPLTRTGRRGSWGRARPRCQHCFDKGSLPTRPSPAPRHMNTPTPSPGHSFITWIRKVQGVEVRADGFQEKRTHGACVSDSTVSPCPLALTAQSTAASFCHWRGIFASLLAGKGSQPRPCCQHWGGRPVPGCVGAHILRHHSPPASEGIWMFTGWPRATVLPAEAATDLVGRAWLGCS